MATKCDTLLSVSGAKPAIRRRRATRSMRRACMFLWALKLAVAQSRWYACYGLNMALHRHKTERLTCRSGTPSCPPNGCTGVPLRRLVSSGATSMTPWPHCCISGEALASQCTARLSSEKVERAKTKHSCQSAVAQRVHLVRAMQCGRRRSKVWAAAAAQVHRRARRLRAGKQKTPRPVRAIAALAHASPRATAHSASRNPLLCSNRSTLGQSADNGRKRRKTRLLAVRQKRHTAFHKSQAITYLKYEKVTHPSSCDST